MRAFRRIALRVCLAAGAVLAVVYALDDVASRLRGKPTEQVKVDRYYAEMNHWNQIEYSVGTPVMETCVDALMPHFGYQPCWYLRRHNLRQVGNP